MSSFLRDLRYGIRSLLRQPLFTGVAVVVLALGIGANTAVFSVINAVLLRPLPYPDSGHLMLLREKTPLFTSGSVSLPNFLDWRASQKSFTDLAILNRAGFGLSASDGGREAPERVNTAQASANLLGLIGLRPILGRDLTEADDVPGAGKVVLISEALWRRRFAADPTVIGRRIMLDEVPREIIGVLPPTFALAHKADVLLPLADLRAEPNYIERGNHPGFSVIGRLKSGVTLESARADMDAIARELDRRYPDSNTGRRVNVRGMLEYNTEEYRDGLYLLFGAVLCVLLIACANVANLQLARASGRVKELAVRAALGASRWRLIRQMLTESAVLGLIGGAAGVLLAMWAIDAIVALVPAHAPRFDEIHLDWAALTFAATIALGTGLLVGVWPAWRISGAASMAATLHESSARGSSGGASRVRARSVLVVAQVALALVLLAGAGVALRSFFRMHGEPLGFDPEGILTMSLELPKAHYKGEAIARFYETLLERVRNVPGVAAASTGVNTPFDDNEWDSSVHLTGTPPDQPGEEPVAEMNCITPDYFKVLGMAIKRGRDFDGREAPGQPKSAIVDESFVKKFFPDRDPLGQHIDDNQSSSNPEDAKKLPPLTIVGVVGRTINDGPDERIFLDRMVQVHLAADQFDQEGRRLLVRVAGGDPLRLVEPIRQAVLSLDPDLPISSVATMEQNIAASYGSERLTMVLLGVFAILALALATVGLYGVMALSVTQRTREIGIRLALGAQRSSVLGLVMRQGATLVMIGLAIGLVVSIGLGRFLATLFYGVGGNDLLTLLGVCVVLAAAALLACWIPARRATRVDPMVALRDE